MRFYKNKACRFSIGVAAIALLPGLACAQTDGAAAQSENASNEDIIVTGTLVRGIAPVGTNVIAVGTEQIATSGAINTNEILRTIPQMSTFNTIEGAIPAGDRITTNRPNLRSLPGAQTSGGSTTLVLMNGHRIVGMGIVSTTPDPDIIPPGAMERVEIVADGGSAVYGSDAVAGVLNFITRKDFDGAEVKARYGIGEDFHTFDTEATLGHKWSTGSIFASYNYSEHSSILGSERNYIFQPLTASGLSSPGPQSIASLMCSPGNATVTSDAGRQIYALPYGPGAAVAGSANQCDESDYAVMYPVEKRHTVMVGVNQQLSDSLSFDMQAFYMRRDTDFFGGGGSGQSKTVSNTNPFFAAHQIGTETQQTVDFRIPETYGPFGQTIRLSTWGITPTFTADLGSGWQLRLLGSYSESETNSRGYGVNDRALTNALAATDPSVAFNPYDPASTNPATLAAITNYGSFGRARQRMTNGRAVLDGTLFDLPGGGVKLAAGIEYIGEGYKATRGDSVRGAEYSGSDALYINGTLIVPAQAKLNTADLTRNVKSAFGELVVPIFGAENGFTGMQELSVSLSGRYDDYNDVGSVFNPKIGVTFKPFDSLRLRGSWGKSFNAPSLSDSAGAQPYSASYVPLVLDFLKPPADLIANGTYPAPISTFGSTLQTVLILQGNDPDIKPQKAQTLSLGADFEPEFIPGLRLSATYWKVKFKGQIDIPPITVPALMYGSYARLITINPTPEQIASTIALTQTGTAAGTQCILPEFFFGGQCTYGIINFLKTNLGDFRMDGLDFSADYTHPTSFGSIDFRFAGTYELNRESRASATDPWINQFNAGEVSRLRFSTSVGAQIGKLRAQAIWYHKHGYDLPVPVGLTAQSHVKSFNTIDTFMRYELPSMGLLKNAALTLTVKNILNQDPPLYNAPASINSSAGYSNGNSMGRIFQIGVETKF